MTTSPNPVDVYVGKRVRARRMQLAMSQERLGGQLGLTFQQVQKYEKGTNRISASKLFQVAGILGVEVAYFFEGLAPAAADGIPADLSSAVNVLATRSGAEMASLWPDVMAAGKADVVLSVARMAVTPAAAIQ